MGACTERRDVAQALRKLSFFRDHSRRDEVAYMFRDGGFTRRSRAAR